MASDLLTECEDIHRPRTIRVLYYATFETRSDTGEMTPERHTGGLNVSDQDFFFDEDEKPAAKSGAKKGSAPAKAATPAPPAAAPADAQSVTLTVAVLIGVIGILLGVVVGLFIGKGMATPAVTATDAGRRRRRCGSPQGGAPQLTQEQIQAGEMPAGHPPVGGAEASGSAETTAKK